MAFFKGLNGGHMTLQDRINKFLEKQEDNDYPVTTPKHLKTPEKQIAHHVSQAHKHYDLALDNLWHNERHARHSDIGDSHAMQAEKLAGKQIPGLNEKRNSVWPKSQNG
jgi:hypothetical protein